MEGGVPGVRPHLVQSRVEAELKIGVGLALSLSQHMVEMIVREI